MENKVTKKMRFEEMKGIMEELGKTELVEFIDHEIELIDRKAMNRKTGNDKKTQENNAIAEIVLEELAKIGKTTITDLLKKSEDGKTLSNQKITAVLKPYIADGTVVRTMEKKSTFFQIAQ